MAFKTSADDDGLRVESEDSPAGTIPSFRVVWVNLCPKLTNLSLGSLHRIDTLHLLLLLEEGVVSCCFFVCMVCPLFFWVTVEETPNPSNATNRTAFAHLKFTFSKSFFAWTLTSSYLLHVD